MGQIDERILRLKNLEILDTEEEQVFDEIVQSAIEICRTPMSSITLLDTNRQWFKASIGVYLKETDRSISICSHTVDSPDNYLIVEDLSKDPRFKDNSLILGSPHLRSYAGVCLTTDDGLNIGTVAVYDTKERPFTEREIFGLRTLALGTMRMILEKSAKLDLDHQNTMLKTIIKNIESFNYTVAHDVKAPLRTMQAYAGLLLQKKQDLTEDETQYLSFIRDSSNNLEKMVKDLLDFSKQVQVRRGDTEYIDTRECIIKLGKMIVPFEANFTISVSEKLPKIFVSKVVFERVMHNLLANAFTYQDEEKPTPMVRVDYANKEGKHLFLIQDNGQGMHADRIEDSFKLFHAHQEMEHSTGIGLFVVKELLNRVGGDIKIASRLGKGTLISVYFPLY